MKRNLLILLCGVIISVSAQAQTAAQRERDNEVKDSIAMAQNLARILAQQQNQTQPQTQAPAQPNIDNNVLHPETVTFKEGATNTLYFIGGENDSVSYTLINNIPTEPTDNMLWAFKSRVGSYTNNVKCLFYMGNDGSKYTTKVVVTPSNDPDKNYDVHFESRKLNEGEYHKGRVIVLDYNKNPWLVKVEYSNDKGVYFLVSLYFPKKKE